MKPRAQKMGDVSRYFSAAPTTAAPTLKKQEEETRKEGQGCQT